MNTIQTDRKDICAVNIMLNVFTNTITVQKCTFKCNQWFTYNSRRRAFEILMIPWFAFERYADECVSRTERSPRGSKLRGALGHTELARTQSGDLTVIEKEMASISGFSCAPRWQAARRCVARRKTALSGISCLGPLAPHAQRSPRTSPPSICSSA